MTARRKPQTLAEQDFEHTHVLGPILWAVVAYTGAMVLHLANTPALYVLGAGAGVCLLAPWVAIHRRFTFLLMAATTTLLTYSAAVTPFRPVVGYATAGGGLLFGLAYHALRKYEPPTTPLDKQAEHAAARGRYAELLELVGAKGLTESRRTPFAAGLTVVLLLPVDGKVTLSALQQLTEPLGIAAARAGIRATFEFEKSPDSRAEVLMHVFERDVLAETLPYPFERTPKSIHTPIPLGRFATGEECSVRFREKAALIVGIKGAGKSNLINIHLAWMTGCSDAVVWLLDGKGSRTVGPWIQDYLDGITDRPVIDWPAFTEEEFDYVLMATNAVIKYRSKPKGVHRGKDKIEPTPAMPAVLTIVEEASVITGVTRRGKHNRVQLAQDGVVQGRSEAVDWIFATQRPTVTMIGNGDMKSNLDLRYGLGVTEEQDARMIFGDARFGKALFRLGDDLDYKGTFLMQAPGSRVMPVKGYRIESETIPGIARSNAAWAGTLDRETADFVHAELVAAGVPGGYYGRWDRIRQAMGLETETAVSQPETKPQSQAAVSPGAQAVHDAVSAARSKRETERIDATFEELVSQLKPESQPVETTANVPPILRLMLAVFHAHGDPTALPTKVLCQEIPGDLTAHALGRLMGLCNVSPVQNITWDGTRNVRGYELDALETSIKRGSWTQRAFDWDV
jgi:hypothetical protein